MCQTVYEAGPCMMLDRVEKFFGKIAVSLVITAILFVIVDLVSPILFPKLWEAHNSQFRRGREIFFEPRPYSMYGGARQVAGRPARI